MHITKDNTSLNNLNIWNTLDKCKSYLNSWSQRDISIIGRICLTKMECISRLIYPVYSISFPKNAIKAINQANFILSGKEKHTTLEKECWSKNMKEED